MIDTKFIYNVGFVVVGLLYVMFLATMFYREFRNRGGEWVLILIPVGVVYAMVWPASLPVTLFSLIGILAARRLK